MRLAHVDQHERIAAIDFGLDFNWIDVTFGRHRLVVANVDGTLLAYRNACAECGGELHDGELVGGALACPSCRRSFFLPRAGRSMDDDLLQLEPVPLLREQGRVKVALAQ